MECKKKDNFKENLISDVTALMQKLISIPSSYFNESEIMDFVFNWFRDREIKAYFHEYHESKITNYKGKNVVCELFGSKPGPTIHINGHLDTVNPCNGWSKDPYAGTVEDDKIFGLGALDMKSGCCAIMIAIEKFYRLNKNFRGKIISTFVSDEEGPYGLGTNALIEDGLLEGIDFSIVTEPSAAFALKPFPNICLGARGGYALEVEFFGKAAHAALPHNGISAAVDVGKFICQLENIIYLEDDLLGQGVACVVALESDGGACSVPHYSKVKLFWHIVTGEDETAIEKYIVEAIEKAKIKCDYKISFRNSPTEGSRGFMPYKVDKKNYYVVEFFKCIKNICGVDPSVSYFQSIGDFNYLGSRTNAPVVIFGAEGENFHSSDEYATLTSISKTADIIYDFLVRILSK